MTILETFIKLRDDLKTWVTNNLNQKANISYVDEKFDSITEFDPTDIQKAIDANTAAIDKKVDKVDGMGLSTNDYTNAEKDKLATVEADANFYEHPAHTAYDSGLYKVTVDGSGHVSGATLAEKEDIVALGIPAQDTTYDTEISGISKRIDDVEDSIIKTNKTLSGVSQDFEDYKLINNNAVATNTSGIEANKAAIEVLNGDGDGSVKKSIDDAFNDFAANVTNDGVVNTYKELIDYAAEHGPEFTKLVGEVDAIDTRVGKVETDLNNHVTNINNPHGVTKEQIGLEKVDNTSDLEKPISNAMQEALNGKADLEHAHEVGEVNGLQDSLNELQLNIDTHIVNKNNPHEVSPGQIGAYTIEEVDTQIASLDILVDTDDDGTLFFSTNMLTDASEVLA